MHITIKYAIIKGLMDSVDYIGGDFTQADGLETLCHRGDEVMSISLHRVAYIYARTSLT